MEGPLVILHVIEAPLWTGAVAQTFETALGLRKRGHDVALVTTPGSILWERAAARGLELIGMNLRSELNPAAILRLSSIILRRRVDVVHAHRAHAHTIGLVAAWLTRRPFVVSRHTALRPRDNLGSRVKYRARAVTKIVAVSRAVADVLVDYGVRPDRLTVIHDGIDPDLFGAEGRDSGVLEELGLSAGALVVCKVANAYGASKGHDTFLAAARRISSEMPDARFLLVGKGTDSEKMRDAVGRHGLEALVTLAGYRPDVPDILAAADVLVNCPTTREGLSVVVLESMATGLPVVATDVGGIPEIVRDGETGLLVPPGDPVALARAVCTMLTDASLAARLSEAGTRLVREEFSVDRMVESTEDLYRRILAAGRR
ncbi:MAG: glycosyltransferase [Candidatus Eisenbacteria bacterium]